MRADVYIYEASMSIKSVKETLCESYMRVELIMLNFHAPGLSKTDDFWVRAS